MCRLWVYNAEIFSGALGTSPHQWFNRGKEIQKSFFGDTLIYSLRSSRNLISWDSSYLDKYEYTFDKYK